MDKQIQVCEQAARQAGEILLKMQSEISIREKGPADLVTEADVAAQGVIQQLLSGHFPEYAFIGEENLDNQRSRLDAEYCWIVDPLDGTTNYAHGMDNFSVSIGLAHQGRMTAGVVYDPTHDQMFRAVRGGGAYRNDKPISTSRIESLDRALIAASFSPKVPRDSPEIHRFLNMIYECQALRRLGSAALNFSYVAAGMLDGYWASSLKVWDLAAGSLILTEAGGAISGLNGEPFELGDVPFAAAATPALQADMVRILSDSN